MDTVVGYTVPLDTLVLDPDEIGAFRTLDYSEFEAERQIAAAAAASMKMPSAQGHQKRCRDAADDDVDAGGANCITKSELIRNFRSLASKLLMHFTEKNGYVIQQPSKLFH